MRCNRGSLALLVLPAIAGAPAAGADYERGRALYESHCEDCHSVKVYERRQSWPTDPGQLRGIVNQWQLRQKLWWSSADVDNVVYYLNVTRSNE